jgi:hypothetical protein
VRTGGRWGSSSGAGDGRSWLLIKHRDDWAGDVDITEFAPLSVKSQGDFEDILAADRPDVWESNRPAKGGEAGAMLATIIERAARLKAGKAVAPREPPAAPTPREAAAGTPKPSGATTTRAKRARPKATRTKTARPKTGALKTAAKKAPPPARRGAAKRVSSGK